MTAQAIQALEKVQLLPCPFCGGKPTCGPLLDDNGDIYTDRLGVYCHACDFGLSSKPRDTTQEDGWPWHLLNEAIDKWNTRTINSKSEEQKMKLNTPPPTRTMLEDTEVFRKAIGEHVEQELQTIFGLPVVVTDAVPPRTALFGSYPKPERDNMTLEEYAAQCAKHFTKIKLSDGSK